MEDENHGDHRFLKLSYKKLERESTLMRKCLDELNHLQKLMQSEAEPKRMDRLTVHAKKKLKKRRKSLMEPKKSEKPRPLLIRSRTRTAAGMLKYGQLSERKTVEPIEEMFPEVVEHKKKKEKKEKKEKRWEEIKKRRKERIRRKEEALREREQRTRRETQAVAKKKNTDYLGNADEREMQRKEREKRRAEREQRRHERRKAKERERTQRDKKRQKRGSLMSGRRKRTEVDLEGRPKAKASLPRFDWLKKKQTTSRVSIRGSRRSMRTLQGERTPTKPNIESIYELADSAQKDEEKSEQATPEKTKETEKVLIKFTSHDEEEAKEQKEDTSGEADAETILKSVEEEEAEEGPEDTKESGEIEVDDQAGESGKREKEENCQKENQEMSTTIASKLETEEQSQEVETESLLKSEEPREKEAPKEEESPEKPDTEDKPEEVDMPNQATGTSEAEEKKPDQDEPEEQQKEANPEPSPTAVKPDSSKKIEILKNESLYDINQKKDRASKPKSNTVSQSRESADISEKKIIMHMLKFNPLIDFALFRRKGFSEDIIESEVHQLKAKLRTLISEKKLIRKENKPLFKQIQEIKPELVGVKPQILETTEDFLNVIEEDMFHDFEKQVARKEQCGHLMFRVFFSICVDKRDLRLPLNDRFWESLCEYLAEYEDYFIDIIPRDLSPREVFELDQFLQRQTRRFENWGHTQSVCEMTYYLGLFTFEILKELGLGRFTPQLDMEETEDDRVRDLARRVNWLEAKQSILEEKKKLLGIF